MKTFDEAVTRIKEAKRVLQMKVRQINALDLLHATVIIDDDTACDAAKRLIEAPPAFGVRIGDE